MSDLPLGPSSPSSAEVEVPPEVRRATAMSSQAAGCVAVAIIVLFPAIVYFGFFGLLLLDDVVLETHFVSESLSQEGLDWLVTIYWPLIVLTRWALGMG